MKIPDKKESMEQPANNVYFIKKNQRATLEKYTKGVLY